MKVGDVVGGRYEILRPIGRGGMGAVFEALHVELGRRVALKVLDGSTDTARLAQEGRALAALNHPNVVQLIDARPYARPPFLVMDLVEGQSLDDLITTSGPLAPKRAALIAAQLLSALGAAHRAGIIHRDVKPSNVLVTDAGPMQDLVKVVDFGIAKLTIDPLKQTTAGALLGSLAYMAPEQLLNRPVDARVDIFATGVTLYKMTSGRIPFDGPSAPHVVLGICEQEPAPLAVPPALRSIVERAMKKDPAARFASADEMRAALQAFAESAPSPSHGASVFASTVNPPGVAPLASTAPAPAAFPGAKPHVTTTAILPPLRMPAPPAVSRKAIAIAIASVAGVIALALIVFVSVRLMRVFRPVDPSRQLAIDIPPETKIPQAEEDAIRRSLPAFERCVRNADEGIAAPGTLVAFQHRVGVAIQAKEGGGSVSIDGGFLGCMLAVDRQITGVDLGRKYRVRL